MDTDGDPVSGNFAIVVDDTEIVSPIDNTADLIKGDNDLNDSLVGTSSGEAIYGFSGDDTITAGSGDDILYGGSGDDILTGGSGSDVFYWDAIDNGASDTINDFSSSEGDVLDLSDILQSTDTSTLDGMLNFALIGNDTEITVTKDNESQSITLKNVDLVTGATDDQAIIQGLLDSGSLDSL
jgi:Ca2+-binding RTX toxin-like protein